MRILNPAAALLAALLLPSPIPAAAKAGSAPDLVPKWGRFERTFRSDRIYTNALQDAALTVVFTSPLGVSREQPGFWDGARNWRVRFSPDVAGHWTYRTVCSDPSNRGLHGQTGELLCTAAVGHNPFELHGPVRVAADRRHFEHADGTPFFWLADTAWKGPLTANRADWKQYVRTRAAQQFTVVQWSVAPGADSHGHRALAGTPDCVSVNPEVFQELDSKFDALRQAGLLNAIAPLSELEPDTGAALTEEQAALVMRYAAARWSADPVVWLIAVEGDVQARSVPRWKKIGQAAFAGAPHAPVILYPGSTPWLLQEFRDQPWVDAFSFHSVPDYSEDGLKWTFASLPAQEWYRLPTRPLLPVLPFEANATVCSRNECVSEDLRRAAYWSWLLAPGAGLTYNTPSVAQWQTTPGRPPAQPAGKLRPAWQGGLALSGAEALSHLAKLIGPLPFSRLRPEPALLATPADAAAPQRQILAASTDTRDLQLVYVPQGGSVELNLDALPRRSRAEWFNPRTGASQQTGAELSGRAYRFAAPGPEDWLLVLRASGPAVSQPR